MGILILFLWLVGGIVAFMLDDDSNQDLAVAKLFVWPVIFYIQGCAWLKDRLIAWVSKE